MMRVSTLINAMMYGADEAEIFTDAMSLISRCSVETLRSRYGDRRVKKFNVFEDEDGLTILEVVFG